MHPDLERCRRGLREVLAGLSPDEAQAPRGGRWSVAQTLEHLDLAYTLNAAGLERRVRKGAAPARPRTITQALARFVVVTVGYFPTGRRAPAATVPQGRPFADIAAGLDEHLVSLDRRLSEAEAAFGPRRSILDHPVLGPLSVSDWRRFHWVHTRHHLLQIQQKRKSV